MAAFSVSCVFFLYQNFSEIRIDTKDYQYQLVELKHLSTKKAHSLAYGITSKGEVIGQSMGEDGFWHTVIWSNEGHVKDLGVREEFRHSKQNEVHYNQPFSPKGVWIGPPPKDFAKHDNTCTGECKLLGEVADEVQLGYETKNHKQLGFIKTRGKSTQTIETLPNGKEIYPNSANIHSQVVGWGTAESGSFGRAFYFKNGKTIDLGAARGGHSSANDLNDLGQIVGETLDEKNILRPVLWSVVGNKVSALDLTKGLGAYRKTTYQGRANSINNNGEVVGLLKSETESHPFYWTANEGVQDLNSMTKETDPLRSNREWVLEDGRSINNCGQIVGWGRKVGSGNGFSVLLKPTINKPGCS